MSVQLWRMRVIRGERVIETRVAPVLLAESYAIVMQLRYPNDRVVCDPISDMDAAHPPDSPHDPRE